jgi:hypothetical protein
MIGFVWLFWLCAGVGFLGIWFGSAVLLIVGRIRKSRTLTVGPGVAFGILSMLAMVVIFSYVHATSPGEVFKKSFGFEASEDVVNIKSEYWVFADSGHTFLMFKASPATVEKIVARGLNRVPESFFPSSNIEPPNWWVLPSGDDTVRYGAAFSDRDFSREVEVLIHDRSSDTVFFHFIGSD